MTKPTNTTTKVKARTHFTVPVYRHLKKFIIKNYKCTETIKVENYSTLGDIVTLCLRDPQQAENNDQYRDRLTANITLVLSARQAKLGPRMSKLVALNVKMDRVFKEHLLAWIQALRKDGIAPFTACKIFLDYYDIDESEYSLDAAYKHWQRSQ